MRIEIESIGQRLVRTSYKPEDCLVLLKDLTDDMKELSTEEREKLIQSGTHYSEMLPKEDAPSEEYEALYEKALADKKYEIAKGIAELSAMIMTNTVAGKKPVIISLARAGIPVGVLIKRYIKKYFNIDCSHYAISIIRDRGIDTNAMEFIYRTEIGKTAKNLTENFFFIDGWTGKGMIKHQLDEAVAELKEESAKWDGLKSDLYVLADPANITKYCGTREDYLLPSACLNSTVSGLTSRTILNKYVNVDAGDFHGAYYFEKFESIDKTNEFIDTITECFKPLDKELGNWNGLNITMEIAEKFGVKDFKKIKPGIGETTRVLLRRVPWLVLINETTDMKDQDIQHILMLCEEKMVNIERFPLGNYKVCGIIKDLSADA